MEAVKITCRPNGPLMVEGTIEIVDQDGNPVPAGAEGAVFLCRCGHSANKPFCDGSHKRMGFKSE